MPRPCFQAITWTRSTSTRTADSTSTATGSPWPGTPLRPFRFQRWKEYANLRVRTGSFSNKFLFGGFFCISWGESFCERKICVFGNCSHFEFIVYSSNCLPGHSEPAVGYGVVAVKGQSHMVAIRNDGHGKLKVGKRSRRNMSLFIDPQPVLPDSRKSSPTASS